MTEQKPEHQVDELTDQQLDKVSAGTPPKQISSKTTSSTKGAIEIEDYGFGVSMPVTTS